MNLHLHEECCTSLISRALQNLICSVIEFCLWKTAAGEGVSFLWVVEFYSNGVFFFFWCRTFMCVCEFRVLRKNVWVACSIFFFSLLILWQFRVVFVCVFGCFVYWFVCWCLEVDHPPFCACECTCLLVLGRGCSSYPWIQEVSC